MKESQWTKNFGKNGNSNAIPRYGAEPRNEEKSTFGKNRKLTLCRFFQRVTQDSALRRTPVSSETPDGVGEVLLGVQNQT